MTVREATKRNLFELESARRAVIAAIEAAGGEITPEQEAALAELDDQLVQAVDRYGWVLTRLDAEAQAYRERSRALAQRARVREAIAERLRERMLGLLAAQQVDRLSGQDYQVSVRESEAVVVDDLSLIPLPYLRTPEPNLHAIKQALRGGEAVPGTRLESRPYLVVR
jgi:hypothetical protein